MELLTTPKTNYLLNASLETLHVESSEWLREINFWNDELNFFMKLIAIKREISGFPASELGKLEKQLTHITNQKIERLRKGVESHERLLSSLFKADTFGDEESYRYAHKKLLKEMYEVNKLIRDFKKDFFSFIHKHQNAVHTALKDYKN